MSATQFPAWVTKVVPLHSGKKKPSYGDDWPLYTITPDEWDGTGNVGVHLIGITEVDVDAKHGAPATMFATAVRSAHRDAPEMRTRDGGWKFFFAGEWDGPTKLYDGHGNHVGEIRSGHGKQAVMPPSVVTEEPTDQPYKWVKDFDQLPALPMADAMRWTGTDKPFSDRARVDVLVDSIPEGERNESLFLFGCLLRGQGGFTDDEIEVALHSRNTQLGDPRLPQADVDKIVRSVCKYERGVDPSVAEWVETMLHRGQGADEKADVVHPHVKKRLAELAIERDAKRLLAELDAAELINRVDGRTRLLNAGDRRNRPLMKWLAERTIPYIGVGQNVGPTLAGKSFFTVDLGLRIANGMTDWLGTELNLSGSVLFVLGEGNGGFQNRINGWLAAYPGTTDEKVHVFDGETNGIDLATEVHREALVTDIELAGITDLRLIVIDTQGLTVRSDEDNNSQWNAFIVEMKKLSARLKAFIMLVHHTGHEGERGRGASAQAQSMDAAFLIKGDKVKVTKVKEGPIGRTFDFSLEPSGDSVVFKLGKQVGAEDAEFTTVVTTNRARMSVTEYVRNHPGCSPRAAERQGTKHKSASRVKAIAEMLKPDAPLPRFRSEPNPENHGICLYLVEDDDSNGEDA